MSAPKCPLCGSNHWQRDPHIWPDEPQPKKSKPIQEPEKPASVPEPEPTTIPAPEPEKPVSEVIEGNRQVEYNRRWREKNKEKHREYMREYMKAKRAKARE